MRHTTFKSAALSLAVAGMASAQTWSLCNPVEGDDCKPNPAFGGAAKYDFTTATKLDDLNSFFTVDPGVVYNDKQMSFDGGAGASMIIFEESNAPTLTSKEYLFFGKVECVLRASPGQGIITSIVLQSDALDEIDWEFIVPRLHHRVDPGRHHFLHRRQRCPHRYARRGSYPQTPMQLKLGTWVGGKGGKEQQGTIDWAGGLAQWDQAPFAAHYQKVTIQDYAGGKKAAREYVYTKGQGSWESIKVVGGKESDAGKFKDTTEDPVKSETSSILPSTTSKLPSSAAASASASISAVVSSIEDVLSSIVKTSTISSAPVSSSLPVNTTTIRTTSSAATTLTSAEATTTTGAAAAQSSAASVDESAATHMQASALVLTLAAIAGVYLW
ncbi:cell wall glucanosyltransferase Mwg2 [Verticillium alfalfae VaMs.102]|uniref:Cell wall glucanosyltransferase Mwg2 n=1 Tax=Verticillium alfalfae (strain VaMs.102 / ATCC MYA-4576 / FGSC 10136) TaxID=526221 RepID=C9SD57_VERA1|nr:cell wall glucanosyltransferase Mwg2 [Verticillium alfalfae VaMs.102]EEY17022.1 cell wall glucanosyltransferase Mwg2 [Verticillium alfalfae VaMs.102]